MKDRLLTLAFAVGAFALFYALMLPKPAGPQERPTRPVTTEAGPNGYLALQRWLAASGVEPVSLRVRFDQLGKLPEVGPTGNLMISTAPHLYPMRDSEVGPLRDWISAGNTLLVVAGLSDTPDWSMGEGADAGFLSRLQAMTGLNFAQFEPEQEASDAPAGVASDATDADQPETAPTAPPDGRPGKPSRQGAAPALPDPFQKLATPARFDWVPNGPHPLVEGVKSVLAQSEYPTSQWRASSDMLDLVLELAQDPDSGAPMLWLARYGNGQIILSAYGSILTNKLLGERDNARLLANIVAWSRAATGKVIIDDAHQGLVAFYDPKAFFSDPRLHGSLWWLLGLWLVFVLGPQRLRAAGKNWNPVDITSFVRASGGFMARVLRPAAAARRLFANFFDDLRRGGDLPMPDDGFREPPWDWMRARGSITTQQLEQLQAWYDKVQQERRIDLPKLHNLLNEVRASFT